ncbi:MAG: hypothetical protein A2Y02_00535 [Omnitrophica bacterium GWA2_52_12]|nr:MAG: hypothetical protein A2Y02_00535 [Omnitrophica bacterium GWA2_52_12]
MPEIYHVVAMSRSRIIGKDNKLPWHFPEDLKHFKKLTMGSTVIMGRKTFESIGKPLPGRENFILSRGSLPADTPGVHVFRSVEQALKAVQTEKAFIIGGAELYSSTMFDLDGIYLTLIDEDYAGDAQYPPIPYQYIEKERSVLRENPKIEVIFYGLR